MSIAKFIINNFPQPVTQWLRRRAVDRRYIGNVIACSLDSANVNYYCPCCQSKLKNFVPVYYLNEPNASQEFNAERYAETEQNVQCPVCRTLPRHRILALYFQRHLKEMRNKRILYFAQENGIMLFLHRNRIQTTTADFYVPADLKVNLEDTQFPDNSWDWVICNHVLEHVNDYQKALRELYRILKPGGTLIISFPILESLPTVVEEEKGVIETDAERRARRLQQFGQADHLRIFGADSASILLSAGFKVSKLNGDKMPKEILPITGPADYDVNYLFVCKKPEADRS